MVKTISGGIPGTVALNLSVLPINFYSFRTYLIIEQVDINYYILLKGFASGSHSDSSEGTTKNSNSNDKNASEKKQSDKQMLLSVFEINIIRYALALDDTKPEDLDPFFLIDFMNLPANYFLGNGPQKYGISIIF